MVIRRVKLDCLATDGNRFSKKAYKPGLIAITWSNLIQEELSPLRL